MYNNNRALVEQTILENIQERKNKNREEKDYMSQMACKDLIDSAFREKYVKWQ